MAMLQGGADGALAREKISAILGEEALEVFVHNPNACRRTWAPSSNVGEPLMVGWASTTHIPIPHTTTANALLPSAPWPMPEPPPPR
jgi:hypothetical protein